MVFSCLIILASCNELENDIRSGSDSNVVSDEDVAIDKDNDNNSIEEIDDCIDENKDHICDICGVSITNCIDENFNHICDICNIVLNECMDVDLNHNCDICGAVLRVCENKDNDHDCDICSITLSECIDDDSNHVCDICNIILNYCRDEDSDDYCDSCGICYVLKDDDTYEVRGCNNNPTKRFILPEYNGKAVTSIASSAFFANRSLSSVVIPSSITSIRGLAFSRCGSLVEIYNLSSINITKGSQENGYIGYNALDIYTSLKNESKVTTDDEGYAIYTDNEEKILLAYEGDKTELILPQGITAINKNAFASCTSLMDVYIPNSVISIGEKEFYGCKNLLNVNIPDSVINIGNYAFYGCTSLTNLTIGNSVTSIGEKAFFYCENLLSVNIPASVTSIGYQAFILCKSLTGVYITDIRAWCGINFDYDANPLTYAHDLYLNGRLVKDLTIPYGVTEIKRFAFEWGTSITSVTIPNSVTSIGYSAFSGCYSIASINIPDSVTNIGGHAFALCYSLISVTVPSSVTSIGYYAVYGCTSLKSLKFVDTSTWYRTKNQSNWNNKTGGTETNVSVASSNAELFVEDYNYADYYWYRL